MSSLRERIEGLVAKWRAAADDKELVMVAGFKQVEMATICADELAAALVAEGQGDGAERTFTAQQMLDAFRPWAKLLGKQEAQINDFLAGPGAAAAPSLHKEGLEVNSRSQQKRIAAMKGEPASTFAEGPLSEEDLAALDSLRETHPNLWRHIRECGQAVLLLKASGKEAVFRDGAGWKRISANAIRKAALEEAADAFEREYIKHEGVMGAIRGLAAIRVLASPAGRTEQPASRCQQVHQETGQCELRAGHEGSHLAGYIMWPAGERNGEAVKIKHCRAVLTKEGDRCALEARHGGAHQLELPGVSSATGVEQVPQSTEEGKP